MIKSEININTKYDIAMHVGRTLADVERDLIMNTLARCGGNRTWAAEILGITLRKLREKLSAYNAPLAPANAAEETQQAQEQAQQEDHHLSLLTQFEPGRRLPS